MVVEIFIAILTKIINFFVFILPAWRINDSFLNGFVDFVSSAMSLSIFFPVGTLLTVISAIVVFEIVLLIVKISTGFLSIIRGGGHIDI